MKGQAVPNIGRSGCGTAEQEHMAGVVVEKLGDERRQRVHFVLSGDPEAQFPAFQRLFGTALDGRDGWYADRLRHVCGNEGHG